MQPKLSDKKYDVRKKCGCRNGLKDVAQHLMLYLLYPRVKEGAFIRTLSIRTLILADGLESQGLTIVSPCIGSRRRASGDIGGRLNEQVAISAVGPSRIWLLTGHINR